MYIWPHYRICSLASKRCSNFKSIISKHMLRIKLRKNSSKIAFNKSKFALVMAWYCQEPSHYQSPYCQRFVSPYGLARAQCVRLHYPFIQLRIDLDWDGQVRLVSVMKTTYSVCIASSYVFEWQNCVWPICYWGLNMISWPTFGIHHFSMIFLGRTGLSVPGGKMNEGDLVKSMNVPVGEIKDWNSSPHPMAIRNHLYITTFSDWLTNGNLSNRATQGGNRTRMQ